MTLKEAYTEWAKQPRNRLAVIYRQAIEKVLLKENADIELYSFTTSFVRGILQASSECNELKAQAVSALMCIIEWGRKNGYCGACAFGLEILQPEKEKTEDASPEDVHPEGQRHDDASHEDVSPEEVYPEDVHPEDQPKYSTISRPVVELSSHLEVMRTFPSASECIRVTKITSLYTFLKNHTIRNGRYYAYKDEWESGTWKPQVSVRTKPKPSPKVRKAKPRAKAEVRAALKKVGAAARAEVQQLNLQELSDQQLFDELKRRGFEGTLTQTKIVTVTI